VFYDQQRRRKNTLNPKEIISFSPETSSRSISKRHFYRVQSKSQELSNASHKTPLTLFLFRIVIDDKIPLTKQIMSDSVSFDYCPLREGI
jgi:hypothetical protein